MTFLLETIRLGLANLRLHKLRAFLTALGIILGVAAVIIMVSIGEGSKHAALIQIERLGAKLDGILRNHQIAPNGTLRDTVVFSIIASEWPTAKAHLTYQLERPRS